MITPDLLEIWVKTRVKASSMNLELKWERINGENVASLYENGKIIKMRSIGLGLYSILEEFIHEK